MVPAVAAFEDVTIARKITESTLLPKLTKLWVKTAVADSPTVMESVAASMDNECAVTADCAGGTATKVPNNPTTANLITLTTIPFNEISLVSD